MKKTITILMASTFIALSSGCAVQQSNHLSQVNVIAEANNKPAVEPVIKATKALLNKQYAPASTKFHLAQPAEFFGKTLVEELRNMGYGIIETPTITEKDKEGNPIQVNIPEDSKLLAYVWDIVGKDLYRVMLQVEEQRYAAVFSKTGETFRLVSPWTAI